MVNPIPARPQEPRWWVSVNGDTEGPYGHAYIIACLGAGQIPASALLCLEGGLQWQPLSNWPQFSQFASNTAVPQFSLEPGPGEVRISMASAKRAYLPGDVKGAILYAKVISPLILLLSGCVSLAPFNPEVDPVGVLCFALFFLGIEAFTRGIMFIGAFQAPSDPKAGVNSMWIGCWGHTILTGLALLFVLFAYFASQLPQDAPVPDEPPNSFGPGDVLSLVVTVGEFIYLLFMLSALASFRRRNK